MAAELAPGCTFTVDRGPDWLFLRPQLPPDGGNEVDLAESVWEMMQQHLVHRVVLELENLNLLRSWLIGQLINLHKRVTAQGGTLRICGLSDENQEVLRMCRLEERFPQYANRANAVMAWRPAKPR
jgi:anti-anti-sigma factor